MIGLALGVVLGVGVRATHADLRETAGLSGHLALTYFSSNHDLDERRHFPGAALVLKQRLTLIEGVRWIAEARVLAQQIGHEDADAPHGSARGLRYVDEVTTELREAYVELGGERWELRAGKQIVVWGRADELNPTDVITPKDFRLLMPEGLAAYRFGTPAVRLDLFGPAALRLTGLWLPFHTPSVIPLTDLPPGVRLDPVPPALRVRNSSAGVKLDRSGGRVDASLAYFYGFNLLPEVRIDRITADPARDQPAIAASLRHSRQHMAGADFATAAGRFGYRGEVAYVHPDNARGRRLEPITRYLYYVLGVERSFPAEVSLILQYVGRWVPSRVDPARALRDPDPVRGRARFLAVRETQTINQQLDEVQNGWSLRIAKRWRNDTLLTEILGVHYVERQDFFVRPRVVYDLADGWQVTVGGEIFGGPARSFLGRLEENTGAFAELRFSF